MKTIISVYAEKEEALLKAKERIEKFLKNKTYIYKHTRTEEFLIRKGNEYFVLISEETLGGGVKLHLVSGVKERPNTQYYDYFYNGNISYSIERSRKWLINYIKSLKIHRGLTITGAAALGFNN